MTDEHEADQTPSPDPQPSPEPQEESPFETPTYETLQREGTHGDDSERRDG